MRCWKFCLSTRRYLWHLIDSLKNVQQFILYLQHIRHQLSLDGPGLLGLDVDCVNSSSYFFRVLMYPCKWNHSSSEKNDNCGSISPSTIDCRNQLQKWTLLAGSRSCKAWITVVLWDTSFRNCVSVLALDVDTPVIWARRFSDFLGVC
jgi:hypothetical protein